MPTLITRGVASAEGFGFGAENNAPVQYLYTANNNNTVDKITLTGVRTPAWATITSSGNVTRCLTVDPFGNVYTINYSSAYSTISKITSAGAVTSIFYTTLYYDQPYGIASDYLGNIYIANFGNYTITKISASGTVTNPWATLSYAPYNIAVDSFGTVYTTKNNYYGVISKITSSGIVIDPFATITSGYPSSIAIDASGNIYTGNSITGNIYKTTPSGTVSTFAAIGGPQNVFALTIDSYGNVYSANSGNNTISKITPAGTVTNPWATLTQSSPQGIVSDANSNIYTVNVGALTMSKVTSGGTVTNVFSSITGGFGNTNNILGI